MASKKLSTYPITLSDYRSIPNMARRVKRGVVAPGGREHGTLYPKSSAGSTLEEHFSAADSETFPVSATPKHALPPFHALFFSVCRFGGLDNVGCYNKK